MAAPEVPAPEWLAKAFPGRQWRSLRSCALRVDSEGGAGLDLEASELGYFVDAVEEKPGQDAKLCAGTAVISIAEVPLVGLDEEALEAAFGEQFCDGVELLLLEAEELRQAAAERDGPQAQSDPMADVVLEHGSVVHVPVGSAAALQGLPAGTREELLRDLATFSERSGVRAELYSPEGSTGASVVLSGVPDEVSAARPELDALLKHYHLGAAGAAAAAAAASEAQGAVTVEVEGMVMQSLPARNRRRRKAADDDEAPARSEKRTPPAGAAAPAAMEAEPTEEGAPMPSGTEVRQFEYRDHTADVILHSWGKDLKQAIEQVCVAFFSYMTELDKVELHTSFEVEATGHDILDMLYHLLDEFLFHFGTEFIMCRRVEILELDEAGLRVRARGFGEKFDLSKHPQGTEIKAITMHQMKILTPETLTTEDGTTARKQSDKEGGEVREGFPFECYVLVDI